jgi:hypothetical protein
VNEAGSLLERLAQKSKPGARKNPRLFGWTNALRLSHRRRKRKSDKEKAHEVEGLQTMSELV